MNKKILLHACCAPCCTVAAETLKKKEPSAEIAVYYYNPNIEPREESELRFRELDRYLLKKYREKIPCIEGSWDNNFWDRLVTPLKTSGEKGERCRLCYYIRLLKTFEFAVANGFSHVSTTLSTSPHKNFSWICELGKHLSSHFACEFVAEKWDFRRSVELSREYRLYRQNYCGCRHSFEERNSY